MVAVSPSAAMTSDWQRSVGSPFQEISLFANAVAAAAAADAEAQELESEAAGMSSAWAGRVVRRGGTKADDAHKVERSDATGAGAQKSLREASFSAYLGRRSSAPTPSSTAFLADA